MSVCYIPLLAIDSLHLPKEAELEISLRKLSIFPPFGPESEALISNRLIFMILVSIETYK